MTTIRDDGTKLPKPPRNQYILPLLAATGLLLTGGVVRAQVALEVDSGSARIWRSSGEPTRLSLGRHQRPRVAVPAEGGVIIAGDDQSDGDLFFLHQTTGSAVELPSPPLQDGPLRTAPVILTAEDRMEGVAWLEGTGQDDFSILASVWNGTSWEDVEVVSAGTGRAQLALASTVLDDGSWLVLWAGYDGNDDDIFWSRRVDGRWTQPERIHANNKVPDVLPTVVTHGDMAHAAWSYFDGSDYRIRTARWNGSSWTEGETLAGKGTVKAELESRAGRAFMTYRSVEPEAWNVVELDRSGNPRTSSFVRPFEERPLVVIDERSQPALYWPWREGARPRTEPRR